MAEPLCTPVECENGTHMVAWERAARAYEAHFRLAEFPGDPGLIEAAESADYCAGEYRWFYRECVFLPPVNWREEESGNG
jgi:hypothetical protein